MALVINFVQMLISSYSLLRSHVKLSVTWVNAMIDALSQMKLNGL